MKQVGWLWRQRPNWRTIAIGATVAGGLLSLVSLQYADALQECAALTEAKHTAWLATLSYEQNKGLIYLENEMWKEHHFALDSASTPHDHKEMLATEAARRGMMDLQITRIDRIVSKLEMPPGLDRKMQKACAEADAGAFWISRLLAVVTLVIAVCAFFLGSTRNSTGKKTSETPPSPQPSQHPPARDAAAGP